jgi:hypothetical protein
LAPVEQPEAPNMSYLDDRPSILLERLLLIRELLAVEEFERLLDTEGLREEWEGLQGARSSAPWEHLIQPITVPSP